MGSTKNGSGFKRRDHRSICYMTTSGMPAFLKICNKLCNNIFAVTPNSKVAKEKVKEILAVVK